MAVAAAPSVPEIQIPEIDDEQIARDISLGDAETSTKAVKALKEAIVGQVKQQAIEQQKWATAREIWNAFLKDYPEIAKDQMLIDIVTKRDVEMSNNWKKWDPVDEMKSFNIRLRLIGNDIMQWKNNFSSLHKKNELVEKKKQIHTLSNINTKQAQKETRELSEKEARDAAIKEMMDRRRKRG